MSPVPASTPASEPPDPALIDRVRGLLPVVHGIIGTVQTIGIVSAIAATVAWVALFGAVAWPLSLKTLAALVALAVLLIPAAGTFLGVLTLREVLALPARLRALPGAVTAGTREAVGQAAGVAAPKEGRTRSGRLWGFVGVVWKLRGIVEDTRGSWLRTLALARFARLASLPFALALVAAFALNFVVIGGAFVVVAVVLLF